MAQVSPLGVPSLTGIQQTSFGTVCILSGGFVLSLKEQADFSKRVKEQTRVKNLAPDVAGIHLKNTVHLI